MVMWFTLAFRNIAKNGRRSLMTILAIGLGFGAINLFQGYVHSTYDGLMDSAIHGAGLGNLTIYKQGFLDKGKLHPERFQFSKDEVERITALVSRDPDVRLVTPRLPVSGILSNGRNSTIFIAEGMVAKDDAVIRGDLTKFDSFHGRHLSDADPPGVVLGTDLARMLDLKPGSDAVALSNSYDGMANALDVSVRGVYNTGATATNDKMVLMTLPYARDLLDYRGAERLVVLLKRDSSGAATAAEARKMEAMLAQAGFDVEIKTWADLSVFYNQVKNMFDMIFFFIFTIVLVIVVMSVVNTMTMSVMERTREIGTLRALGLKQYGVKFLFSSEGMLLGVFGILLGAFIFFFVYSGLILLQPTYVPPASSRAVPLRVDLVLPVLARNTLFMLLLSTIAAFLPARRSASKRIVDALGHI